MQTAPCPPSFAGWVGRDVGLARAEDGAVPRYRCFFLHPTGQAFRSLLVGGTATDVSGRRVRFLEISVGAEPQDFAITIVVPFASDPGTVLPRIEAIVSSFETLDER